MENESRTGIIKKKYIKGKADISALPFVYIPYVAYLNFTAVPYTMTSAAPAIMALVE